MKIWQRNAVVATVVLFVAVSIFLSWSYQEEGGDIPVYQPGTEVAAPIAPGTCLSGCDKCTGCENGGDCTCEECKDSSSSASLEGDENPYFSEARMSRQRARDSALSILNGTAVSDTSSQDAKALAVGEIQVLAQQAMTEASVEGLIKAKGFFDCVAYINNSGVSLVVSSPVGGLTAEDVAKITDICLSETTFGIDSIKIMEI